MKYYFKNAVLMLADMVLIIVCMSIFALFYAIEDVFLKEHLILRCINIGCYFFVTRWTVINLMPSNIAKRRIIEEAGRCNDE